jgi:hypothetical protein
MALGWSIASVVNNPLRALGSNPLYLCIPPIRNAAGGDLLYPHYSWDHYGDQINQNNRSKGPKKRRGTPLQGNLYEKFFSRGLEATVNVGTSKPAAEISAKGRDKPVLRNLPEVKPETSLLGVSDTDTPLQGASISGIPAAGGEPGHLVSGVGGIRLAKKASSGCARRKMKKKQKLGQAKHILGASSNREMQVHLSREKPRLQPPRGQGQKVVPL